MQSKTLSPEEALERFLAKIDIGGEDECWPIETSREETTRAVQFAPAPALSAALGLASSSSSAVRLVWRITYGEHPKGSLFNKCGDATCVNPAHYSETKVQKPKAEPLSEIEQEEALKRLRLGLTTRTISRRLGVNEQKVQVLAAAHGLRG